MPRFILLVATLVALLGTGLGPVVAQEATPDAGSASPTPHGTVPLPLTGERRAEFESFVASTLAELRVPGASVAVVQGGDIVYRQGFGVKEVGGTDPVTADTLMMIGSVTKSMTSMLAATLVDDGMVTWETPAVDLLPEFAVADPTLTARLTVGDLFCACTGVPRQDLELVVDSDRFTPEALITSAVGLPLVAPFGERFQYSNQIYAIGGYAATVAAGGARGDLAAAYRAAMRERVLGPVGMPRSTFALNDVLVDGDYAVSHGADLNGELRPLALLQEDRFVNSVAPAGALWSTAAEMARYLQTELARGVAPSGARVVSAESLERTWAPRTAIPAEPESPPLLAEAVEGYGMGWVTGAYKGRPLVHHSGGTLGFLSQAAFLPESDLGIVILTNGGVGADVFTLAVQFRLLELLFTEDAEIEPLVAGVAAALGTPDDELLARLGTVDPAAVTPYLGRYTNPSLGEIAVRLRDGRLVLNAGEVASELLPLRGGAGGAPNYLFADAPLAGTSALVAFRDGADGSTEVVLTLDEGATEYVFVSATPITPTPG
jgi:CubicO group peptidase (beta-lactamase class C family)